MRLLILCICLTFNYTLRASVDSLATIIKEYEAFYKSDEDRLWPSFTAEEKSEELQKLQSIQSRLTALDVSGFELSDQIDYDVLKYIIDDKIANIQFESYLMPLTSEGGFVTGIYYALSETRLADEKSKEKYRRKLEALPDYIDWQIGNLKVGLEKDISLPKLIIEKAMVLLKPYYNMTAEESTFTKPLRSLEDDAYEEAIRQIITDDVLPALKGLLLFLKDEYLPSARDAVGISNNSNGKPYYEQRVKYFTTLDITPGEVFEIGQAEVARIKQEMQIIIDSLHFDGTFADFIAFLRSDPQFYAETPEEILSVASWLSKKAEMQMPLFFGKLARMPFTVQPVPEAIAPNYTSGRYSSGNYKTHRAGQYWVNTYRLDTRPLYALPALTLHEAVPGHHHQIMLSKEIEGVSDFRRRTYLSAFGEGWGLYCEWLGKEMGMYETPYDDFGRLTYEMWRACRLVVDVGMHYKGWTRKEAVDFMAGNTALSLHEVNTEIDRYIGWPAQAVSYKMGEIRIKKLRQKAEDALGDDFDIRAFHDALLENGSVLMSTLEVLVDQFIENEKVSNQ